ncbi:MAG: hypothetical protein ACR2PK_15955, partial [Acidimicrobiales bacterium]
ARSGGWVCLVFVFAVFSQREVCGGALFTWTDRFQMSGVGFSDELVPLPRSEGRATAALLYPAAAEQPEARRAEAAIADQ